MQKKLNLSLTALGLVALLVVFVNVIAGVVLRGARYDLTQNGLYTLTDGSRNIVGSLQEQVTLKYYVSSNIATDAPGLKLYADRARELLDEYAALSGGMLELRVIDPEPFSEAEDEAVSAGLQGLPANAAGDLLYLGLVGTNAVDDQVVIPFLHPAKEQFLEYDLSRLVHELSDPKLPVVGLLSSLPLRGGPPPLLQGQAPPPQGWFIASQIEQLFELRDVAPTTDSIDDDVDILMIVHPKELGEPTLRAIDDFALRGGNLLVFVDPHAEEEIVPTNPQNPMASMMAQRSSDMFELFAAWGIQLIPGMVAADRTYALQVTTGSQGRPEGVDYVSWLSLTNEAMNTDDTITAGLGALRMPNAGVLEPLPGATTTFEPLVSTTAQGATMPLASIQFMPEPKALLADFVPGDKPLVLAARLSGPISAAFPARPPADLAEGAEPPTPTARSGRLNAIVVADADMLADRWWVSIQNMFGMRMAMPQANNGDFVINALENLSGSDDLISIRSRGSYSRPFELIDDLRRQADQRFAAKERELQARLTETEGQISRLQSQREDGSSQLLTAEQQEAIEQFQQERFETRKELRDVRHQLETDIEGLQTLLKLVNVLLAPLVIVLLMALAVRAGARRPRTAPRKESA